MFEAVLTFCLLSEPDLCRETLLPGFEAPTRAECAARLENAPPDLVVFEGLARRGDPACAPSGPAAAFQEIAEGVFAHRGAVETPSPANRGDVSNVGFVLGEASVAVIDASGSREIGEEIFRAVRARTDLPISHLILTHMHPDHVFGASVFAEAGAEIVGHQKLARALTDRAGNYIESFTALIGAQTMIGARAVTPDAGVDSVREIDLGGRVLTVRAWPNAHSHTDLTVMDEATSTLFVGDLVFQEHAPALDGSARGWLQVLEALRAAPAARIVPGHGGPVSPWPAAGEPTTRYLSVLIDDARAAVARGDSLLEATDHIAQSEARAWRLFKHYNPRNATVAFTELEWE